MGDLPIIEKFEEVIKLLLSKLSIFKDNYPIHDLNPAFKCQRYQL